MSQDEKMITLPGREDMLERLMKTNDSPHLRQKLYPRILEAAGQELFPLGVVMMLTLAFSGYLEGLPPVVEAALYMEAPNFIDALVDDKEAAAEAKAFLEQALKG